MTMQMSPTAAAYVRSVNDHDSSTFIALFADGAVVNDGGREFRGVAEIKAWSGREIFDAQVTLEVIDVAVHDGATVVTAIVDGNFDRTGLPDPVIIDHHLTAEGGKIVRLTCELAAKRAAAVASSSLPKA
jgi:hypothetical protein